MTLEKILILAAAAYVVYSASRQLAAVGSQPKSYYASTLPPAGFVWDETHQAYVRRDVNGQILDMAV